jgi:hypothetical protein
MLIAIDHGRRVGCAWGEATADRPNVTTWAVPKRDDLTPI